MPAGGVATTVFCAGEEDSAGWAGLDALGDGWAAAGVSPAAARAIAHPINLIFTPVCIALGRRRENRAPDLAVSIGAAFPSLKQEFGTARGPDIFAMPSSTLLCGISTRARRRYPAVARSVASQSFARDQFGQPSGATRTEH